MRGGYIQIRMFADRLEVRSPGGLFGNVTVIPQSYPDDSTGHILVESIFPPSAQRSSTVGPGIPSTAPLYRQSGLPPPESSRRDNGRSGSSGHGSDRLCRANRLRPLEKYVLKVRDVSIDNLVHKSDEEKILSYIIKHGSINNSECRELLNVNDDRAYYLLKKLSEKGKLKTLKKGKGRRYVVP